MGEIRLPFDHGSRRSTYRLVYSYCRLQNACLEAFTFGIVSVDLNDARAIHDDARGATRERGVDFT